MLWYRGGLVFEAHRLLYHSAYVWCPYPKTILCATWYSSQFENNHFTEMCCGSEAGSYLRLIDSCVTQLRLKDLLGPVPSESKEEEEEKQARKADEALVVVHCWEQHKNCWK